MRYLLWLFSLVAFAGYGQGTLNTVALATKQSPSYTVNVQGKLLPGFNFKASSTGSFYLRVNSAAVAVSPGKNVQLTERIKVPGILSGEQVPNLSPGEKSSQYDYFDGLGRKIQTVSSYATPLKNDAVSITDYPNVSVVNTYLPYPKQNSTHGSFVSAATIEQKAFYLLPPADVAADSRPYSVEYYENSPIERVNLTLGVGDAWFSANRTANTMTGLNAANEVLQWSDYVSGFPALTSTYPSYYALNTLTVNIVTNEEEQVTKQYQNLRGQKILSRVVEGSNNLDTYYIYNPAGLLMYVIQPEGVVRLSGEYFTSGADQQAFLDRWAFQYQYDDEQRVIAKRAPGVGGWTYIVYDQWNRVVLTQDPVQRLQNKYAFTKYDVFNRPIMTGIYTTSTALATLRTAVAASTVRFEVPSNTMPTAYTFSSTYPTGIAENDLLTVSYYDSYWFLAAGWDAENNSFSYVNVVGYPQKKTDGTSEVMSTVAGYNTGGKVRVLESNVWLNTVLYYDKKYHVVQTIAETHRGGVLQTANRLSFAGKLEKTQQVYSSDGLTTEQIYSYDHADRLVKVTHAVNNGTPVILRTNRYNELGQLVEKNTHSSDNGVTFLQSEDRRYNIRGWLRSINNSTLTAEQGDTNPDLFGMELEYNPVATATIGGSFTTKKYYAGNISAVRWSSNNLKDTPIRKIYGFDYDNVNRLRKAYYATDNAGNWNGSLGFFDEEVKGYDANGNIKGANPSNPTVPTTGLVRYGNVQGARTIVDDLTYNYDLSGKGSNRLIGVADAGNALGFRDAGGVAEEYQYDQNGNLIFDLNKGISNVVYNHLNLPKAVQITRTSGAIDQIEYTYDASGNKLRKVVKVGGKTVWTTDYVGVAQYDNNQLSFLGTSEGRVVANGGGFDYEYFIKDNVDNVRVVYGQAKESKSYRATMETELATEEESPETGFQNIAARRINTADAALNYTKPSERILIPARSALCSASMGGSVGPAKSLRVQNGDAVYMEVYAKYTQVTGSPAVITAAVLGAAVNSAFGIPNTGETSALYSGIQSNAAAAAGAVPAGAVQPKAYIAFLFFDDNYVFQRSGAIGISTDAYNAFERLSRSFTADKDGYLYIYVASESSVSVANVYFDEFFIHHQKNTSALRVFQSSDYYPFGLSFNEFQADRLTTSIANPGTYQTELRNRYLFQGKELQKDLDLNWYNMEARMMDPSLGRFLSIDPKAESDADQTPYHYVLNNPVLLIDPTGESWSLNPTNYQPAEITMRKVYSRLQTRADYFISPPWHWVNEYSVPDKQSYMESLYRWQGKGGSRGYDEQYLSGQHGTFLQVLAGVGNAIPVFGPFANFVKSGREGNWREASLQLGMAATEFGVFAGGLSRVSSGLESATQINEVPAIVEPTTLPLSSLKPTHAITKSKAAMKQFVATLQSDGMVMESISYVELNGTNYIVDGHHRYYAAQKLRFTEVPVTRVELPFRGYETPNDFFSFEAQPSWWNSFKP